MCVYGKSIKYIYDVCNSAAWADLQSLSRAEKCEYLPVKPMESNQLLSRHTIAWEECELLGLSLIPLSDPTRLRLISFSLFFF